MSRLKRCSICNDWFDLDSEEIFLPHNEEFCPNCFREKLIDFLMKNKEGDMHEKNI